VRGAQQQLHRDPSVVGEFRSLIQSQGEPVIREAGENMQVNVEHLLPGDLAIGEERVHSLATHPGVPKRPGDPLGDREQMPTGLFIEIVDRYDVFDQDDEDVSRIDRLDIHERAAPLVAKDDACWCASSHDITEDAVAHHSSSAASR
jgi:hypothetical protein